MFVTSALPSDSGQFSEEAAEIERFRARHRRMCRGQQQAATATAPSIEALDVDDGRTRKISAKWRLKQQQTQRRNRHEDGLWPQSAGTEMHIGFNAFDFSSSPEAFYDEPEEAKASSSAQEDAEERRRQHMAEVATQVTAMGFNSASLWEQSFPGLRQPGGPIRQLPTHGQHSMAQSLWRPPVHCDQRRAQPPYYT
ncbi:hypothetical protein PHYPSEUDO_010214 [Phytophthora pseudosyringae]|uniref:Uncharacterized protein n=1 Tax=Phytophthora pseudosyringae TaxID=221518 RepID=A0A8T1WD44_9STRA|nr:hypothetical protein PHYPSEUDO_010214 [Phytophthora pseudosyringae]